METNLVIESYSEEVVEPTSKDVRSRERSWFSVMTARFPVLRFFGSCS